MRPKIMALVHGWHTKLSGHWPSATNTDLRTMNFCFCFLKAVPIYLKGRLMAGRREREKGIFHLVGALPDMAILSEARILELHLGLLNPSMWAIFHCFPWYISRELDQKWSRQGIKLGSDVGYWRPRSWLKQLCHSACPCSLIFSSTASQDNT